MTITRIMLQGLDKVSSHLALLNKKHPIFPTLDPFLVNLIQLRQKRDIPALSTLTPEQARIMYRQETARIKGNFKVNRVENIKIPIPDTTLEARVYYPDQAQSPFLLAYFHGGGGVIGDVDTHDDLCRLICQHSRIVVVSVAYRLAPEYPAPIGHQDAFEASKWLYLHREQFGVLQDGICVGGDSAGGNIAIYAGLALKRENIPVQGQLLFYPSTDFSRTYPSEASFGSGLFLDVMDREWFQRHSLQGMSLSDSQISPIYATDLKLSAKTILRTAELDVLRDEAEAYVQQLRVNHITVNFKRHIGVGHAYGNLVSIHQLSRNYIIEAAEAFQDLVKDN